MAEDEAASQPPALFGIFGATPAQPNLPAAHGKRLVLSSDDEDDPTAPSSRQPAPPAKRKRASPAQTTQPASVGQPVQPATPKPSRGPRPRCVEVPVSATANGSTCTHDVSLPPSDEYAHFAWDPQPNTDPPKKYPFELDAFQREAVAAIEADHSVLVSAHTSAGKTAVAEYAIALALRRGQRVIYTSPIKALSNQKYRELAEEFTDVGLMTGDTTINPSASCIVMTTEILRSMIYRGSEVVRELKWVIFDEVHKMSDRERGVVWEETIVLLPLRIRFVFLSATIPNAREFAQWVVHNKTHPCHAVYTASRPVPLQHYIYPDGSEGVYLIVDEKGTFRDDNYAKALAELTPAPGAHGNSGSRPRPQGPKAKGPSSVYKVVRMIMERGYDPVIVFAFSRRDIENMAVQMSKLDFNSDDEKALVEQVFQNAVDSLSDEDQRLPQITHALPLLRRGIGIHHSGLLPLLKEIVEILFQEGLIKALFATETFSMGLNMPAKTVVFTAIRKYDGEEYRFVSGGEYIQMSGRAGRRGLDERGLVILVCDEKIESDTAKLIMKGQADPLRSTFHLKYNMLLNLLRAEEADPEYVIKRSFAQFQADTRLPENELKLEELETERDAIVLPPGTPSEITEQDILDAMDAQKKIESLRRKIRNFTSSPTHAVKFLQPGRMARIRDEQRGDDYGWGVIVNYTKQSKRPFGKGASPGAGRDIHVLGVLLFCIPDDDPTDPSKQGARGKAPKRPRPAKAAEDREKGVWIVVPCSLDILEILSAIRVHMPSDLRPAENRLVVGRSVQKVFAKFPDGPPLLDPIEDQGIKEPKFEKLWRKLESRTNVVHGPESVKAKCEAAGLDSADLLVVMEKKLALGVEMQAVKRAIDVGRGLILTEELKRMKRVLRRLGFVNAENIVEVKGRTACEINTADELVVTELMFNGSFNEMEPAVLVALLSCFVYDERAEEELVLPPALDGAKNLLHEIAKRVATVTYEAKIPIDVEEYVTSFEPSAMNVVYAWCGGKTFLEVCNMTPMFEGSIIRILRRLEELLRQLGLAAKAIGNTELQDKFASGSTLLRRGVAFQASLYL